MSHRNYINGIAFLLLFLLQFSFISAVKDASATSNHLGLDKVDASGFYEVATVQALNKITAKTSELNITIGESLQFGKLRIIAHKCWKTAMDQRPESKILLEIYDDNSKNKMSKRPIFHGWMIASSPSISGLEHPIYDIIAIGCKQKEELSNND